MFPVPDLRIHLPENYAILLNDLKNKIQTTRLRTVLNANAELVLMYWEIGHSILQKQENEGWGAKVIDRLSYDLRTAFSGYEGIFAWKS